MAESNDITLTNLYHGVVKGEPYPSHTFSQWHSIYLSMTEESEMSANTSPHFQPMISHWLIQVRSNLVIRMHLSPSFIQWHIIDSSCYAPSWNPWRNMIKWEPILPPIFIHCHLIDLDFETADYLEKKSYGTVQTWWIWLRDCSKNIHNVVRVQSELKTTACKSSTLTLCPATTYPMTPSALLIMLGS